MALANLKENNTHCHGPYVPPVVHALRKCPVHLMDDIRKELDEMVSLGVIQRMNEPTDWVLGIVSSQTCNGISKGSKPSCQETPSHANRRRDHSQIKFKGSTAFSKLYGGHSYWSVELDEKASYFASFNSPFGRFRLIRFPFGLSVSQNNLQQKMDFISMLVTGQRGRFSLGQMPCQGDKDHIQHLVGRRRSTS